MDTAQRAAFGELLRRYRRVAGLTQEELAARSGVGVRSITDLERAVAHTARRDTLQRLAAALGLASEAAAAFEALARDRSTTLDPPMAPSMHAVHAPTLPASPTPLIGRDAVVATAVDFLCHATTRLLTLTGPGGVGKTCLAVRVAEELRDHFTDGVVFVPLAPLNAHCLVAPAVARALGAREGTVELPPESVAAHLRERDLLLVLDNFEHVAEAAPLVAELLAGCPRLRMLVTSRAAVHVRGEHELAVSPLAIPAPPAAGRAPVVAEAAASPAVALFVARAGAVRSDFTLTPVNVEAVVEICRRLDGLPLALELAAARVRLLLPGELLARLEHRLPLLTGGARDLPERQRTLRAAIDWSYDLLHPSEQALFRRLCVFAGGCTLEAVEFVCMSPQVLEGDLLDWLEALVDKNLLRPVVGNHAGASAKAGTDPATGMETRGAEKARFGMLETVREYGLDQLAAHGEDAPARARHAAYYVALAETAEPALTGPEQGAWLARLEAEQDNLWAALEWARASGDGTTGLRLAAALWRYWHIRGFVRDGRAWLEGALASAPSSQARPSLRARALNGAGNLASQQDEYARAEALHEEALALRREAGDTLGVAASLNNLGLVAQEKDEYERAEALHGEALALDRALGDTFGIAASLSNLGDVARQRLDNARARALYDECLTLFQELGDRRGVPITLQSLGDLAARRGDDAGALELYRQSLALRQELGDWTGSIECLEGIAGVAGKQGRPRQAAEILAAAAARRAIMGAALPPVGRAALDRAAAGARAALGDASFAAAWAAGETLSLEQAIAYAYEEPAQG